MRTIVALGIAVLLTTVAVGQNMNVAESAKEPGDPLRYTVALDGPVKGTVNTIYLSFYLTTAERADQKGLPENFDLARFRQMSPVEYQVDDSVPHAMSGTYLLKSVQLRTAEGGIRNYSYPTDFKQENKVKIETREKDVFPNIKSVEPSH
jgi:hypothetical protein